MGDTLAQYRASIGAFYPKTQRISPHNSRKIIKRKKNKSSNKQKSCLKSFLCGLVLAAVPLFMIKMLLVMAGMFIE